MVGVIMAAPFRLPGELIKQIESFGYQVFEWRRGGELTAEMREAEVAVCMWDFLQKNLDELPNIKMIQLCSAGFEKVPMDEIVKRGIVFCNARGVMSIPIAEWVILKVLEIYKDTRSFLKAQSRREWEMRLDLLELFGKTVGIVGTGSIGSEVAKRAAAFGCRIIGVNTRGDKRDGYDECLPAEQLPALLEQSDIVVLTLPHNEHSHHLMNRETLQHMKDDAVLVNISRGGIIHEEDLLSALNAGKLRGAALDVFAQEPLPQESPFWEHERVLVTPHNSFASEQISDRLNQLFSDNLKAYITKQPLKNMITAPHLNE